MTFFFIRLAFKDYGPGQGRMKIKAGSRRESVQTLQANKPRFILNSFSLNGLVFFPALQRSLPQRSAARASPGVHGLLLVPRAGRLPGGNLRRLRPGDPHFLLQVTVADVYLPAISLNVLISAPALCFTVVLDVSHISKSRSCALK